MHIFRFQVYVFVCICFYFSFLYFSPMKHTLNVIFFKLNFAIQKYSETQLITRYLLFSRNYFIYNGINSLAKLNPMNTYLSTNPRKKYLGIHL
jgi:hypothetical protein